MIDQISGIPEIGLRSASRTGETGAVGAGGKLQSAGADEDFGAILGKAIAGMSAQLREAESVAMSGFRGGASTQEVVEKVMSAEQSLQASIAVRDKIVAAYLEISRMAI